MQIEKLFQVLVVGGALLAGNAFATQANMTPTDNPELQGASNEGEVKPVFCPGEGHQFCEVDESTGKKKVKAGFECCWGTSCDSQ